MSFIDCINRAVKDEAITVQRGQNARDAYERAYKKALSDGKNIFEAEDIASRKATTQITDQAANKRYQRMRNMQALDKIIKAWDDTPDTMDGAAKLLALLEGDVRWKGDNFASRMRTRQGEFHNAFLDLIDKYRPQYGGIYSSKAGMDNLVRELAGDSTGDKAAKELAKIVKDGIDLVVAKANSAGAAIEKNPRWWLPQKQNRAKMRNRKSEWVKDHMDNIDWEHTKWPDGFDVLDEEKEAFLNEAFDSIDSKGKKKRKPGSRGENLADRMEKGRVLYYKDSAAWLNINKKYGDGTPYDALTEWIDSMARNTAMLDIMGTSPSTTLGYLTDKANLDAGLKQSALQTAGKMKGKSPAAAIEDNLTKAEDAWQLAMLGNRASDENHFATTMASTRNITRASLLSSSIFANIFGDTANVTRVMRMNKLSPVKYLNYYSKLAAKDMTRKEAIRAGLIAEQATQRMIGASRWHLVEETAKWSRYISDVSMRMAGVSPHTQIAKWAAGMSFMGEFADHAGKSFDALPFKAAMERHGITASEWDVIRKVAIHDPDNLSMIRPNDLRDSGLVPQQQADEIADKFMDMIFSESRTMVIEATYRARATMGGNVQAGTIKGEVLRLAGEFKSFPITITLALAQELLMKQSKASKIAHTAQFFAYMTIAGAAALQMGDIASGKDPQDMTNPKFWGAAAMKGGSFGYLGDFLFMDYNDYGEGLGDQLVGPAGDFWFDIGQMTIGNGIALASGEDVNLGKQLTRFVGKYLPGSKIPVIKTAFERAFIDQLMVMSDPQAHKSFRRSEAKLLEDKGQERWWKKGELSPDRSPDLSKAWEE